MAVNRAVQQILLCGFMGCGKTSVGQALAFRLHWDFLDTDAMIEKRQGRSIPEIFSQDGKRGSGAWSRRQRPCWAVAAERWSRQAEVS